MYEILAQSAKPQGFSRLKGVFRSGINYSNYNQIVSTSKRAVLGNIPQDMLTKVITRNPEAKKERILELQEMFHETAKILADTKKITIQAINRINPKIEYINEIIQCKNSIPNLLKDNIFKDKEIETMLRAEELILNKIKNILPEIKNVKLSSVSEGAHGNVFRCEFLDSNKKHVIKPLALKLYKNNKDIEIKSFEKINEILTKYTNKQIIESIPKNEKKINNLMLKEFRKGIKEIINILKNPDADCFNIINTRTHGAFAEANSTEYIKYMNGHKIFAKNGLQLPNMFILSEPSLAISKFIEQDEKAAKSFNFTRLGLSHNDLECNEDNCINGICIDIGGISPAGKKEADEIIFNTKNLLSDEDYCKQQLENRKSFIMGSKLGIRILKHIQDAPKEKQEDLFNQIYDEVFSDPNSSSNLKNILQEIKEKELYIKKSELTPQTPTAILKRLLEMADKKI